MEKDLKTITGEITNYIFESEDSMYKVAKLDTEDGEITITGSFPHLDEGLTYDFIGHFKENKYGHQFAVETYNKSKSFSKDGLISYLSSDKFYGIGEKLASNIVEALGTDCIDVILKDPNVLYDIKGLTKAKAQILYDALQRNNAEEQVFIKLYGFGLTSKMVSRLYEVYGVKAANIIEENPYTLIKDVEGYGFKKCDNLAMSLGIDKKDMKRLKASVFFTINNVCYNYGFTFLTEKQLINSTLGLLQDPEIEASLIEDAVMALIEEKKLVSLDDRIYDTRLYNAENKVRDKLIKIYNTKGNIKKKEKVEEALSYVEGEMGIEYTPMQKEAIINALSNKLSIITGGPGTGKSTILKGIINTYSRLFDMPIGSDDFSYKVIMAAPTGRAAKRMAEATLFKASTIHRALGYTTDGNFLHDSLNPLTCSLLIIDEASMLDILLASNLFDALLGSCQIILVGDANQLPAVGPGNVLQDLINTSIFKVSKLNQIMRQAKDSNIIRLSSMVMEKRIDYRIFSAKKEVFLFNYESKNIIDGIIRMLDNFIDKGGDLFSGIQILAPMYNGVAGIDEINRKIQEKYNKEEKTLVRGDKIFKKGDKVLQLKNDRELDIMNGDIGRIIDIVKEEEKDVLMINFDDRMIKYPASNLDSLSLAYAISIHKSQGSEFQNVILPMVLSYRIMLKPKLFYTAITRAKEKLIILGSTEAMDTAIHAQDDVRQTSLAQRINDASNVKFEVKINDPEIPFETLGEYDMDGITPYTFMDN